MADGRRIDIEELKRFVPFRSLAESHLVDLRRKGELRQFPQGSIVFKRDQEDDRLHFLVSGALDLADAAFEITRIDTNSEAATTALDPVSPHAMTAITTAEVDLFSLARDYLDLVLTWDQAGNYLVTDLGESEVNDLEADWMSCLLQSALFAAVPPANIQQLFAKFEELLTSKGDVVIRQGDPGDYFYVVKSGRAQITRAVPGPEDGMERIATVAELIPGDVFGEDALIGDAPRNATITMMTDGALMRLQKDHFRDLLERPVLQYVAWDDLTKLLAGGSERIVLLDVRLPDEFSVGSVDGATNLPLHLLRAQLDKLDDEVLYVTSCDGGRRSSLAAYILHQSGFRSMVLSDPPGGGADDTRAAGG